jgi:hypothetical protein
LRALARQCFAIALGTTRSTPDVSMTRTDEREPQCFSTAKSPRPEG